MKHLSLLLSIFLFVAGSCNSYSGKVFTSKSPKEKYSKVIENNAPILSKAWLNAGAFALANPLFVGTSYKEYGRVNPGKADANAFLVDVKRGQKIEVNLKETNIPFTAFIELWKEAPTSPVKILSADTLTNSLSFISLEDVRYIVHLQPQLDAMGNYELSISTGPGLLFPIQENTKASIGSLWGDPRDGGVRKHEGIDIMAAKGSFIVAGESGMITDVSQNEIGGNVISLRPDGYKFSIYHAHLDQQMVTDGQRVAKGDVIGTVGNTGNARTTVPHLHYGIYTNDGAIDPLIFVKKASIKKEIIQPLTIGLKYVTASTALLYPAPNKANPYSLKNQEFFTEGYTGSFYRVILPNGAKAFISVTDLKKSKPIK